MRTRTLTTTGLLAAGLLLTACSSTPNSTPDRTATAPSVKATAKAAATVDCSDPTLSQADWTANCGDKAGGSGGLSKQFGQTYTWPDGVKVTVTEARIFTAYDKSIGEKASPGALDYQVMVKVANAGHVPLDLGNLSVITAGATNGGEAAATSWNNGAPRLEGRLAPGVTVTKADSESLETKFGRKIVVTVQRMSADNSDVMAFPEFTGSITG